MSISLCAWKSTSSRGALRGAGWRGRLAGALALAFTLWLIMGAGQTWAAPRQPALPADLLFTQPNHRGVFSGPPGTRVTVNGSSWLSFADVSLSLTRNPQSCAGAVRINTYQTNAYGSFSAHFLWPLAANVVGPYYACATQANKGTAFSRNIFHVLASSPASVSLSARSVTAGSSVTVTGHNWLPGPETVNVVIVPCSTVCQDKPVAGTSVLVSKDGSFSQPMTILAGATSGTYYVQAANTEATLSAISAPLQVAGQVTPNGTPLPGTSPTTGVTRATPGAGASQPASQTSAALKDALLAAVLGLVVLLLLIGAITFLIGRSRGADAPAASKAEKGEASADGSPDPGGRAIWRAAGAAHPDVQAELQETERLPFERGQQVKAVKDMLGLSPPALPAASGSENGAPQEQPTGADAPPSPAAPDPAASPPTLADRRAGQASHRSSAFGSVQRILQPPPKDE